MTAINGSLVTGEGDFTPEEKEKIQELRGRVLPLLRPEMNEDKFLVKWLRARDHDVDKAEEMLKKHIRFTKSHGLLDPATWNTYIPPEPTLYFHTAFLGYDKEGSIIRILNIGGSDIKGMAMSVSKMDCIKYASYLLMLDMENQKKDRANDTICDKSVYIIDLKGLHWRSVIPRMVVERALLLLKAYEANFPESLKVVYVVNVPSFFRFIMNWLKTFLPESIISKLEILSEEECLSRLPQCIDPDILPAYLGGNRTDPDGNENCPSLYPKPLGLLIPESFITTDQLEALKNDPEAIKVIVDYKGVFIAEKAVLVKNSTLTWDFQTTDYDIRMGIRYKKDENSEAEDLMPFHRVDSHIFPESGSLMCENPGIYELVFDNSYSWLTSKELYFKIDLVLPGEEETI